MYDIPAKNYPTLKTEIEKLNKRAKKLNCEPITLTVVEEYEKEVTNHLRLKFTQKWMKIEVVGESPCLNGWRLSACVETLANGENLVRTVPNCTVPEKYRTTDMHCDHCNTNRRRKEVFVLEHEDGRTIQVGRSCIADFLGHVDASSLAARAEYSMSADELIKDAVYEDFRGRGPLCRDISEYLGMVAVCVRRLGWVSRKKADEEQLMATSALAWQLLTFPSKALKEFREKKEIYAEDRDTELAAEALAWARNLDGKNDYEYNLGVACRQDYVMDKTIGLVASAISAYQRAVDKVEKNKAIAKERKHLGEIGKRQDFDLTVLSLRYFDSDWGVRTLVVFEDAEKNRLVWWASKELDDLEEGDKVTVKGTVTKHGYYNAVPQTELKRCKITEKEIKV